MKGIFFISGMVWSKMFILQSSVELVKSLCIELTQEEYQVLNCSSWYYIKFLETFNWQSEYTARLIITEFLKTKGWICYANGEMAEKCNHDYDYMEDMDKGFDLLLEMLELLHEWITIGYCIGLNSVLSKIHVHLWEWLWTWPYVEVRSLQMW